MKKIFTFLVFFLAAAAALFTADSVSAATLTFPVIGPSSFSNDYNAPRANGCHCATDIIAGKGQQIVSATSGVIDYVTYPQPSWGFAVIVRSTGGNYYWYLHINNDTPGTDDGRGGGMHAFAPDIKEGNPIKRGQLIGWVGDSGNAEGTVPHLHFEIHKNSQNGPTINPYSYLKNDATRISRPVTHPALPDEILPYGTMYKRKVNVARGDVTGDGQEDLVTGAEGDGSSSMIHTYNPVTRATVAGGFRALSDKLHKGVDVAIGDVDGDDTNELITAVRGKYHAKVAIYKYNAATQRFSYIRDFVAYTEFNTTPRVTSGDIDGDGTDEIITGTGINSPNVVRVFNDQGEILKSFSPFTSKFTGGIDVAAGNLTGGTIADEIAVAPLTKGSSRTAIFDATPTGNSVVRLNEFYTHGSSYKGGTRLSIGELRNTNSGHELISTPNNGARSIVRVYSSAGSKLYEMVVLEEWWRGYYDVAASRNNTYEFSFSTGGNRRGSVR